MPADAAVLGVHDGNLVEIASRDGRAELPARLSNDVEPGQLFAGFLFPAPGSTT